MSFLRRTPVRLLFVALLALVFGGLPRSTQASPVVLLSGFPTLRQQRNLTCESSAASMGTRGAITENQIMSVLPRNANPNLGFRGNPNGFQGTSLIDYGVYATPIHNALLSFGYASDVLQYANDSTIKLYVNRGWPVEVWVTYQLQVAQPRLAAHNGVQFVLVPHEHALLVIGFDRKTVLANDPWTGNVVRYYWSELNRSWGYFGNMALAIEPCPLAAPVDPASIRTRSVSNQQVVWSWHAAAHAAQYRVSVSRISSKSVNVVYQGVQSAHRLVLSAPSAGARYEIDVESVSACGDATTPARLQVQLPPLLPTPTPSATPVPERTVASTPTSVPTETSTPTPTPAASPAAPH
jgi:uncharacterized protein YvpB